MIGVELVEADGTTAPLDSERFMEFWEHTKKAGVLIGRGGHSGNVIRNFYYFCCYFHCVFVVGFKNKTAYVYYKRRCYFHSTSD